MIFFFFISDYYTGKPVIQNVEHDNMMQRQRHDFNKVFYTFNQKYKNKHTKWITDISN